MAALIIARLTLHEAVRRRVVLAVVILTPLVIALSGWGFSRMSALTDNNGQPLSRSLVTLNEATFVILIAFMFSVVLAIGASFLAAPAIASDVESGLLLAMLPRPMRRGELVLGKWLGLAALLCAYTVVAGALELATINAVAGYLPPHPVLALLYIMGQSLVILTLTLLGSTRLAPMACGIIVVVLFGATWIVGIAGQIGVAFHNTAIANAGTIVSLILPSDGLWRGAVYCLEPAVVLAIQAQDPFVAASGPTLAFRAWAIAWILVVLWLAIRSFGRREL